MTAGRLISIIVVGAALVVAHRSYGSPSDTIEAVELQAADLAASRTERLREGIGHIGARMVGPFVRSVSRDTHRLLGDLEPAIRKARPREAQRAKNISDRIMKLDSAAHASLEAGEPITAIRYVSRGKGLIPAVRQTVAEESAFR